MDGRWGEENIKGDVMIGRKKSKEDEISANPNHVYHLELSKRVEITSVILMYKSNNFDDACFFPLLLIKY